MGIFDFLKRKPKEYQLSEENLRWNRFIGEICYCEISSLNEIQKTAVLAFWYDAVVGADGHSGYFSCCPNTDPHELENALTTIGGATIAENYRQALSFGKDGDFEEVDNAFYKFSPSLANQLMRFVEENKDSILSN